MCTLYKGVPHGLALIHFKHPVNESLSFKGVGMFIDGKLHNSPFTCLYGNGIGLTLSKMDNGRAAENSHYSYFKPNMWTQNIDSLCRKVDVSGW